MYLVVASFRIFNMHGNLVEGTFLLSKGHSRIAILLAFGLLIILLLNVSKFELPLPRKQEHCYCYHHCVIFAMKLEKNL